MPDDDLRNADFSRLSVREMTPAQRVELKRRYADFVAFADAQGLGEAVDVWAGAWP